MAKILSQRLNVSSSKMKASCYEVSGLLKAMSHPQRLMILGVMMEGEKTVAELLERCNLSQSQASQFLGRMKAEGLLQCRNQGQFRFYSIADKKLEALILAIHKLYCD